MTTAFKIHSTYLNFQEIHLVVELGNQNIACFLFLKNPFKALGLFVYNLKKNATPTDYVLELKTVLNEAGILQTQFASYNIFFNFSASACVPKSFFEEQAVLPISHLLFGEDQANICFHEHVKNESLELVYTVPAKVYEKLKQLLSTAMFAHSTATQIGRAHSSEFELDCIVYHNSIKLILFSSAQLQIVQYFDYDTEADVCYHLLNVCNQFSVSPSAVQLRLMGMVAASSNLYKEIYKYFLHISFAIAEQVEVEENMQQIPPHFYHHLTALAQCV